MAIFGAGSTWYDTDEQKEDFFANNNYVIGWDYQSAKDLYIALSSVKCGDILYLKSNRPGSKSVRIKGIGIVVKPLIEGIFESFYSEQPLDKDSLHMEVMWVVKEEFHIQIPDTEGKLTNVRAATFYEEYLPFVQQGILSKLFSKLV